jgi:creatinine amidohydrolase
MIHLRPDSVRHEKLVAGHVGLMTTEQLNMMWKNGIASITPNGVLGDARGSTREIGESCLRGTAKLLASTFAAEASLANG